MASKRKELFRIYIESIHSHSIDRCNLGQWSGFKIIYPRIKDYAALLNISNLELEQEVILRNSAIPILNEEGKDITLFFASDDKKSYFWTQCTWWVNRRNRKYDLTKYFCFWRNYELVSLYGILLKKESIKKLLDILDIIYDEYYKKDRYILDFEYYTKKFI